MLTGARSTTHGRTPGLVGSSAGERDSKADSFRFRVYVFEIEGLKYVYSIL